jgi:hypothetical protein
VFNGREYPDGQIFVKSSNFVNEHGNQYQLYTPWDGSYVRSDLQKFEEFRRIYASMAARGDNLLQHVNGFAYGDWWYQLGYERDVSQNPIPPPHGQRLQYAYQPEDRLEMCELEHGQQSVIYAGHQFGVWRYRRGDNLQAVARPFRRQDGQVYVLLSTFYEDDYTVPLGGFFSGVPVWNGRMVTAASNLRGLRFNNLPILHGPNVPLEVFGIGVRYGLLFDWRTKMRIRDGEVTFPEAGGAPDEYEVDDDVLVAVAEEVEHEQDMIRAAEEAEELHARDVYDETHDLLEGLGRDSDEGNETHEYVAPVDFIYGSPGGLGNPIEVEDGEVLRDGGFGDLTPIEDRIRLSDEVRLGPFSPRPPKTPPVVVGRSPYRLRARLGDIGMRAKSSEDVSARPPVSKRPRIGKSADAVPEGSFFTPRGSVKPGVVTPVAKRGKRANKSGFDLFSSPFGRGRVAPIVEEERPRHWLDEEFDIVEKAAHGAFTRTGVSKLPDFEEESFVDADALPGMVASASSTTPTARAKSAAEKQERSMRSLIPKFRRSHETDRVRRHRLEEEAEAIREAIRDDARNPDSMSWKRQEDLAKELRTVEADMSRSPQVEKPAPGRYTSRVLGPGRFVSLSDAKEFGTIARGRVGVLSQNRGHYRDMLRDAEALGTDAGRRLADDARLMLADAEAEYAQNASDILEADGASTYYELVKREKDKPK